MLWGWGKKQASRHRTKRSLRFEQFERRVVFDASGTDTCELTCSSNEGGGSVTPVVGQLPTFALPDLNMASPRASQQVSPRDYIRQVSVWYFGHST